MCEFVANNIAHLWRRLDLLAPSWDAVAVAGQYPTSSRCDVEAHIFVQKNRNKKKTETNCQNRIAKGENDGHPARFRVTRSHSDEMGPSAPVREFDRRFYVFAGSLELSCI